MQNCNRPIEDRSNVTRLADDLLSEAQEYYRSGEYEQALLRVKKAVFLVPPQEAVRHLISDLLRCLKRGPEKEILFYNEIIEKWPDEPSVHYVRGCLFNDAEHYEKAICDLNRAIELGLCNADVFATRGEVCDKLGLYEECFRSNTCATGGRRYRPDEEACINDALRQGRACLRDRRYGEAVTV
jgi:tetratricopeptide (TPR) repeat protein